MASSQDTEITLGTGKVLAFFFSLVALCAAFFGMGYKMGKNTVPAAAVVADSGTTSVTTGGPRPSAVKPAVTGGGNATDLALYKPASQKSTSNQSSAGNSAAADSADAAPDPASLPGANSYYVQVAAVSRQEDGDALVDALKRKQYSASSSVGTDKLYHVQVGPFSDIKSAEDTRTRLMSDGYNPILKK